MTTAGKGRRSPADAEELYGWFTEGFGTRDLQDAWTLLQELTAQGSLAKA